MLAIPLNLRLRQKENYTMDALEFVVSRFYLPLRHFPRLGSAHQVFILQVLQSCASSPLSLHSCLHRVSFSLPSFSCPLTSIFHVLIITKSSSVFLSTCPKLLSLASLILSLKFATPAFVLVSSHSSLFPSSVLTFSLVQRL